MDATQIVSSLSAFLSPSGGGLTAAQLYPAAFDFLVRSDLLPTAHSDNHFDGAGNHTVFTGTGTDFLLDIGVGAGNGALSGQTVHYEAHLGPSGPTFSTSYSGADAMTTSIAVDLSGNGFIQSEFIDPLDGSTSALVLPLVGFNRQDPILMDMSFVSAQPLVSLDALDTTFGSWLL